MKPLRIHFYSENGVPESLKRQMTAGRGNLYGRINCKEFCEELRQIAIEREYWLSMYKKIV